MQFGWGEKSRAWAWTILRLIVTSALMTACYFLVPLRAGGISHDGRWLVLFLALIVGLLVGAVTLIRRSQFVVARSLEALVVTVIVYLLLYARFYASAASADPAAFSQPLDLIDALYFTVTTFATVGYGDIHPVSSSVRLMVTVQMLLNLALLGGGVRLILTAGRRTMEEHTTR